MPPRSLSRLRCLSLLAVLAVLAAPGAWAATGPTGFRGDGSSRFPEAKPPLRFSTDSGVTWAAKMPAWSNASPVVVGDKVFVTAEPFDLLCLSATDGRKLWQRTTGATDCLEGAERDAAERDAVEAKRITALLTEREKALSKQKRAVRKRAADAAAKALLESLSAEVNSLRAQLAKHDRYRPPDPIPELGFASATPVTDGRLIYAVFGNGTVTAFDLAGKRVWGRWLGTPLQAMRGYSRGQAASPMLIDGRLIVAMNALQALDPATGKVLWTGDNYTDYGTPVHVRVGGQSVLVTPAGAVIRVSDGRTLATSLGAMLYVGPVALGDTIFFIGGNDASAPVEATAVQLRSSGDSASGSVKWRTRLGNDRLYSTPVAHDGLVYIVSRLNTLWVLDAATGKLVYEASLPLGNGDVYPSPVIAGDRLYVTSKSGAVAVLKPGRAHEELAVNQLEPARASPVFIGKRMYYRGFDTLYAIDAP
ncbi:MAG: PQQ-binding-like beta-propeller repeat protein [Myxococcota bacterium]